jgi:hypothetical protein
MPMRSRPIPADAARGPTSQGSRNVASVHEEADAAGMPRLAFYADKGADHRQYTPKSQVRFAVDTGKAAKITQFGRRAKLSTHLVRLFSGLISGPFDRSFSIWKL